MLTADVQFSNVDDAGFPHMTTTQKIPEKAPSGRWLQTERAAHEAWAKLIADAPKAAQLMHLSSPELARTTPW